MSLLDRDTYKRPDAEVLPLITPAAARARGSVRRISHATLGTAPPGGEAIDGAGAGEGPQGEAAARPYDSAHSPSLARPRKHPVPHICPTHLVAHPLPLIAAGYHAQDGWLPLHYAAMNSSSVAVVQALLAANPEAAKATTEVRRPSPLAAWMRGPQRSSEVIICNHVHSGVIICNQRALSGTQRALSGTQSHSVATVSVGPSEAISGPLRGHQRYSVAHQR